MSPDEYAQFLRSAFDDYLKTVAGSTIKPDCSSLVYDFGFVKGRAWHVLGEPLVSADLYGLTNILNRWRSALRHWNAWNIVIATYDEPEAWSLHWEFLEALAHECLLRPSSVKDAFTNVATRALHQVHLSIDPTYRDYLEGDPQRPGARPTHLKRWQKEAQLRKLASRWTASSQFLQALQRLNDKPYQEKTFDYRNLHSHALGPRTSIGPSMEVTRGVTQAQKMEEQPGGVYMHVLVPGKMSVGYGLGNGHYLSPVSAWTENCSQFEMAKQCYAAWLELLSSAVSSISPVSKLEPI